MTGPYPDDCLFGEADGAGIPRSVWDRPLRLPARPFDRGNDLLGRGGEAVLQSLDFTWPAGDAGLADAFVEAGDDFYESAALLWVDAEHWTSDACSCLQGVP